VVRDASAPSYLAEVGLPVVHSIAIPPPPPGQPPAVVRGIYMNAWTFGSNRFYGLVALADTTEINSFVIDVKDATGFITYASNVPTAIEIGANGMIRVPNVRQRLALLESKGIHTIARIVVARDALLAKRKTEWAIQHKDGGLWRDGLGEPWVDAFHDSVWVGTSASRSRSTSSGSRRARPTGWESGSTGTICPRQPTYCCRWCTRATIRAGPTASATPTPSPTAWCAGRSRRA
jgi:hypothetical protein